MSTFNYQGEISFLEIQKHFDSKDWDIGYLDEESLRRVALSPLKTSGGYPSYAMDYFNEIIYPDVSNAIVLIRKGHTWDYTLYGEINHILTESGLTGWLPTFTNYKEAAIHAGLGVRARNSLIYSYKFGFDCHINIVRFNKKIINLPTNKRKNFKLWRRCKGCDDCAKACPVGAIHNKGDNPFEYWLDSTKCIDFIVYGDHPTIPSIKKFWHKNVYPEVPQESIDRMTGHIEASKELFSLGINNTEMPYNRNGYTYDGLVVRKDGKDIDVPVCRECTSQPRCSKWDGNYPYDTISEREQVKVIKFFKREF